MKSTQTKKIKLLENRQSAQQEKRQYLDSLDSLNNGLNLTRELLKAKEDHTATLTKADIDSLVDDPEAYLTKRFTEKVKIEGMKLSPQKILQLQEINLKPILDAFSKGKKAKEVAHFHKTSFDISEQALSEIAERCNVYTDSEDEIQIAEACMKLTEAFDHLQSLVSLPLNYLGLAEATKGAVNTFHGERCLKPDSIKLLANHVHKQKAEQ